METSDLIWLGVGGLAAYLLYEKFVNSATLPTGTGASATSNTVSAPIPVATPVVQMAHSVTATPIIAASITTPPPAPAVTQAGLTNIGQWIFPQYVQSVAQTLANLGIDPATATYQQAVSVYETGHL